MVTETAESLPTLISGKVLTRQVINRNGLLMLQYFIATLQGPVMVVVPNAEYLCFCHGADVPLLKQRTAGQSLRFAPLPLESFSGQAVFGVYGKSGQSMRLLQRIANDLGI